MGRTVYDVYDKDGNLIIEKMTSAEIGAALNESPVSIARCSTTEKLLKGRYGIVKTGKIKAGNPETEKIILAEWNKVITPFKKVKWVKEYSPGVKRLKERHCGVAVIKNKSKLKEAMEKPAEYEEAEDQKVRTNGDYIRSMSDEELAEYILKKSDNPMYEICDDVCECCSEWNKDDYHCDDDNCKKAIVCWLKKEMEKGNG